MNEYFIVGIKQYRHTSSYCASHHCALQILIFFSYKFKVVAILHGASVGTILQRDLMNILILLLRNTSQGKKLPFKILLLTDYAPGASRALIWSCSMRLMLFSCLLTPYPFCSPWIKKQFRLSNFII